MTRDTHLLPGVDRHGNAYRVRLSFPQHGIHTERGVPTADQANARVLELRRIRAAGLTPNQAPAQLTLRQAADGLLTRKRTHVSRKTRRPLRPRGIEWWERVLRPWRAGEFADIPLSLLNRARVEDAIADRALVAAKTARDEHAGLTATLRYAQSQGATFDPALLTIERLALTPRKRQALTVAELELLAGHAPDYAQRLILMLGTTGCRISELFTLTDDRVEARALFIPADLNKEGVDKWIELTRPETRLLREQLLARAPGTQLVFPTKTGRPWRHYQFLRLVWYKARERAAADWRTGRLAAGALTPFDTLQPHDLRATAATLMRDAGLAREDAAARLGHADSGELLDRIYDQGDRRQRVRAALDALAPNGLLAEPGAQPPRETAAHGSGISQGDAL